MTSLTADTLTNGRNIAGATFDGSADISIQYANLSNSPWIRAPFAVNNAYVSTTRYVKIGNSTEPVYPLNVIGDVNITGEFRKNGTIFTGGGVSGLSKLVYGATTTGELVSAAGLIIL